MISNGLGVMGAGVSNGLGGMHYVVIAPAPTVVKVKKPKPQGGPGSYVSFPTKGEWSTISVPPSQEPAPILKPIFSVPKPPASLQRRKARPQARNIPRWVLSGIIAMGTSPEGSSPSRVLKRMRVVDEVLQRLEGKKFED